MIDVNNSKDEHYNKYRDYNDNKPFNQINHFMVLKNIVEITIKATKVIMENGNKFNL